MDIHKQAIEKISASKIRKQREAPWDFVYTPFWILQIKRRLKSFPWNALVYGRITEFYLNLAK